MKVYVKIDSTSESVDVNHLLKIHLRLSGVSRTPRGSCLVFTSLVWKLVSGQSVSDDLMRAFPAMRPQHHEGRSDLICQDRGAETYAEI